MRIFPLIHTSPETASRATGTVQRETGLWRLGGTKCRDHNYVLEGYVLRGDALEGCPRGEMLTAKSWVVTTIREILGCVYAYNIKYNMYVRWI